MIKEILIIRLSSIGDIIHCTPVARSLKLAWPNCKITWLVGEVSAELIKLNPYVDETIVWSRERFEKHLRNFEYKKAFALWTSLREKLSARKFYAVLDIHGLFLTGLIAKMAKTDRRIGMRQARELNFLFMTKRTPSLGKHITDKYLGVLTALGITSVDHTMTVVVPEKDKQFAQTFLYNEGVLETEKFVVFVVGTTWSSKNWPVDLFVQTAQMLSTDFKIVLCGGNADLALGSKIEEAAHIPMINAIGKTSLLQMAGIIDRATAIVSGDTGPLHIAAALGIPAVAMFGPTNPSTYAPQGPKNVILFTKLSCSFCHKTSCPTGNPICMSSITPAEVVKQVYRVTENSKGAVK